MWLGCLFALWAMVMVAFAFLLAMGIIIEAPWLLVVPAVLIGWRWVGTVRADRRTS